MGIHKFFAWLTQTFPHLVKKKFQLPPNSFSEGVYVDLNSPIHIITQRLFGYGLSRILTAEDKEFQNFIRAMNSNDVQTIINRCVGMYLIHVYLTFQPKRVFMIAVDGVAPKAKMVQQRLRRFNSNESPINGFEPSMISPGTPFMDSLHEYLTGEWLSTYRALFPADLNIIYSSHREPGEGEHKIFDQMGSDFRGGLKVRTLNSFNPGKMIPYQIVLGADSDLIVLSLTKANNIIFVRDSLRSNDPNAMDVIEAAIRTQIRCWRENSGLEIAEAAWKNVFSSGFDYLDISEMGKLIKANFMPRTDISDFTCMTFLVGNDFLPAVPEMDAIVARSYAYYTEEEIQSRFEGINKELLAGQGNSDEKKKIPPFRADKFWEVFRRKEADWTTREGKINFQNNSGMKNALNGQFEMYPWGEEPLTGIRKRILMVRKPGANRFEFFYEDTGTLRKALNAYKKLQHRVPVKLVDRKHRLNYPGLLAFLEELSLAATQLMESNAVKYATMERQGLEPEVFVASSLGISKGITSKVFVPSAFTGLNEARAFGIYDLQYADIRLPKKEVDEMCRAWLEGAQWTMKYYSEGFKNVNTEWFYPYFYAPSLYNLVEYLRHNMETVAPGFYGLYAPRLAVEAPVEKINVAGQLKLRERLDPEFPDDPSATIIERFLDRSFAGTIYVYDSVERNQVAHYILANGSSKYIDLASIYFTKAGQQLLRGTPAPASLVDQTAPIKSNFERVDPTKITLVEFSRETITIQIEKKFLVEEEIYRQISDISRPYASVLETLFSIMPIRVLKMLMSPYLVDLAVRELTDYFPETFESITEGKYYENAAVPKIPFVSPTRLRRVIDKLPSEFITEIARFNVVHPRQRLITSGKYGGESKEIRKAKNISTGHGYAAPNIAVHTRKRQEGEVETTGPLSQFVTGGMADSIGRVLKAWETYYITMLKKPEVVAKPEVLPNVSALNALEIMWVANRPIEVEIGQIMEILPDVLPYRAFHKEVANLHIGQLKLLMSEVQFLVTYGHLSTNVLYVGAAPGDHIPILSKFFPKHTFVLYDPSHFDIKPTDKIRIVNELFTDEVVKMFAGHDLLFISDIRTAVTTNTSKMSKETFEMSERHVDVNNTMQMGWVNALNPVCSLLKYRIPFTVKGNYRYLDGAIWLQAFAPPTSAETRLVVERAKHYDPQTRTYRLKDYNAQSYENKMHYFNVVVRQFFQFRNPALVGMGEFAGPDRDALVGFNNRFDCSLEAWTWNMLLAARYPTTTPQRRHVGVVLIMKEVSMYLGRLRQPADGIRANQGDFLPGGKASERGIEFGLELP